MHVEVATRESFRDAIRLPPIDALPDSDCTAKMLLDRLPRDQQIFFRISFEDFNDVNARSESIIGRFRTAPEAKRRIRFAWSGDTAGQGWGIDPAHGGMKTFATIARHSPDFFIHCGDAVYCDGPIPAEQAMPDGGLWRNLVCDGVGKVAETLDEFRGRWRYNMLDPDVRAFNAVVPVFHQWDDHEVRDNWSAATNLSADPRYTEKRIAALAARGRRAFREMTPTRTDPADPNGIYRKVAYGPMLDVFFLDLRSYRGPNGTNLETAHDSRSALLGDAQMTWLKGALASSTATWKVIASSKSVGYLDWDDPRARTHDGIANGDPGAPRGREMEIAALLRFIKRSGVQNVVWLTADIHYTAAHFYDPNRAAFQDFEPFWEFVSGPLHAGSFGPGALDPTFGGTVRFQKAPGPDRQNLPPSAGLQFFGLVDIDPPTEVLTVRLMDRDGNELFRQDLHPAGFV